ncbi:hypothetical protein EKG37_17890 [Robertmurraya yapensis]|uniref:SHOCT domain-containing protein n=1 Tax=Bacillus yapensis TaxID=2492960 RepID=A0A3S0L6L8_9BACI|nr:hypothetical protein [Bacillus yapensis]RTR28172.1 hypothetical protein EKG37_17890 [Bacillus yapensis]TKS94416.1 hypothetical protein FAR12_17900 [Bacillus yapensis]
MMNGGHMGSFGGSNGGFYGYNGMPSGFNSFDMMFNGSFMTLIVFALIGVVLFLLLRNQKQQTRVSSIKMNNTTVIEAEEVAKLRYARGEISHDEFQSILQTIKK